MHSTVQTSYDIQYLTIRLSGYINEPTEPDLRALKHCMGYLIHHPHELIV